MRAAAPSAHTSATAARRLCRPRPPPAVTAGPGSGSRSAAHAGDPPTTRRTRPERAAGPAATVAPQSSSQPAPQVLQPVAAGRQHDVVRLQPPQLGGDLRATLGLDPLEALAQARARRVDLDVLTGLRVDQGEAADRR